MASDFLFADEPPEPCPLVLAAAAEPWRILVVDDEAEVHAVTRLALARVNFRGRNLALISAYSAAEAAEVLRDTPDIALILLDVVMETDDAGLKLVRTIREEMGNRAVRIILRTGQPGQAPEESVILEYDINDYKAKTELTTQTLFTTVVSALRAYVDIVALETSRRGLQRILESTDPLFAVRGLLPFARSALIQLATVIGVEAVGEFCVRLGSGAGGAAFEVVASIGEVLPVAGIEEAFAQRRIVFADDHALFFIAGPEERDVVVWLRVPAALGEMERALARVLVSKIGLGFANVCLYERIHEANEQLEARVNERTRALEEANAKLEWLATTDALTGVANRRHIMDLATREVSRARRYGRSLGVLLFDLDHFKRINDTFGHAAGDEALKAVAESAREALRTTDLIARFGGEEFLALLPETTLEATRSVAERVCRAIATQAAVFDGKPLAVTASIGVTVWVEGELTIEAALRRADFALYQAKQEGRDRVVVREA